MIINSLALIACSAQKVETADPVPAVELYQGQLFKAQLAYARQVLGMPDERIFILSAAYRLVPSHHPLLPYNCSLNNMSGRERARWGREVAFQLGYGMGRGGKPEVIYVLGGRHYSQPIIDACSYLTLVNVPHPAGLGYAKQVAWYKAQVAEAAG